MGIKQLKSVTPGSRFASRSDFSELTSRKPEKSLTKALRKSGGRNNTGKNYNKGDEVEGISVNIKSLILKEINLIYLLRV
jgi:Ribosomal protein L2